VNSYDDEPVAAVGPRPGSRASGGSKGHGRTSPALPDGPETHVVAAELIVIFLMRTLMRVLRPGVAQPLFDAL
jgi:hypothetical protein